MGGMLMLAAMITKALLSLKTMDSVIAINS
jgi:hypothetical protein